MRGRSLFSRTSLGLALAAAASGLSVLPLYPVYSSAGFWVALGGGLALGTAVAALGARLKLGPVAVTAASAVCYFAFGGFFVLRSDSLFGILPTLAVLGKLALGPVQVWKDMLTAATPLDGVDVLLIAPYLLGILGAVVVGTIAIRARRTRMAALPVAALFVLCISLSTYSAFAPAAIGALLTVVLLAWGTRWARQGTESNLAQGQPSRRGRAPLAAGMLAVGLAAGAVLGAAAPLPTDRTVLRDALVPPLDVQNLASPLTSFRELTSGGASLKLFTVTGLPQGTSIRLATLDQYDGIVYRVGGNGTGSSGQFTRVGHSIPNTANGTTAQISVTLGALTGVWMPDAGYLSSLAPGSNVSQDRRGGLDYNSATGTAVLTSGLQPGDTYTAEAVLPKPPVEAQLASDPLQRVSLPAPQNVPEIVSTLATQFTETATTPLAQLRAIETKLRTTGFFSNGLEGQTTSRAGHTAERIAALLQGQQMIGDDEQYSVAMALMAQRLGIPARVVMGFRPDSTGSGGPVTITGADVHAWVEVPFEHLGWVSFDPTPPKDRIPKDQVPQHQQKPQPQVLQPPPPVVPPVQLPPAPPVKEGSDTKRPADLSGLWTALGWGGAGLGALALLLAPAALVAVLRSRRRKARALAERASDRMSGGWSELMDLAADHGTALPSGSTRREEAIVLGQRFPAHGITGLAVRADEAVFGLDDPTEAEIAAYWADVDTAARGITGAAGWRQRLGARYFARSVLRELRAEFRRAVRRFGALSVRLGRKDRTR